MKEGLISHHLQCSIHVGTQAPVLAALLLTQLPAITTWQSSRNGLLGPLPLTWESGMEFQVPGFGVVQPWLWKAFGVRVSRWEICVFISVCLSLSHLFLFQINKKRLKKFNLTISEKERL